jgi:phosphatidylglycerophosphatase A
MNQFARWIATLGPVGHLKFAPGTFGSVCGIFLVLIYQGHFVISMLMVLAVFFIAVWASYVTSNELGDKDPSAVIVDEVCGIMVSFLFVPLTWFHLLIGFLAFRFFDIVKPEPVRFLERVPNGFGIVLDDVMAGIYANLTLQLLIRYAHL